jgi:chorismate dehydratase
MVRISAVSYLNTKPFLHGLELSKLEDMQISLDMPSECARKLIEHEVDLGLIPVAVIPALKEAHILPGFCIGADGAVESVKLYSEVPLEKIDTILLDYQSRTSVTLAKILAKSFWKISPQWKNAEEGFEKNISGNTAAVIIGDRTFTLNGKFPFEYDLAEEWKKLTGLPFVFACWVSNKKLPDEFILQFNKALELGLSRIHEVVDKESLKYLPFNVEKYLLKSLKFRLDERAEAGLGMFLEKMKELTNLA